MDAHPDPGQFVRDLAAEDSSLTCYLVAEVLNTQPPQVRDMLLCTSILDQVSTEAAAELAGDEQAAGILVALARSNAFIQPAGSGWYRYHTLFGEVLRLTLRCEYPDRVAACTGELPGGTRGTACSPTRCGTPSERVTGAWPPAWSSMIWRSARSSRREVIRPWPRSSPACRPAKPGPNLSRISSWPR